MSPMFVWIRPRSMQSCERRRSFRRATWCLLEASPWDSSAEWPSMPLTTKGEKILGAMTKEYGAEKGKRVFYASRNAGKITGVDPESSHQARKRHKGVGANKR